MSDWIKVSAADIPEGTSKQVDLEAQGISLAVCNMEGKFHVIDGMCPHVGGPLGEGELDGNLLSCPWHGWQFDITNGACAVRPGTKQTIYPTKVEGSDIFIQLP